MQVLPLASTTPGEISDALSEEVVCWRRHLQWDYEPAARIIRRHIATRTLPGFCLREGSTVVGYCYFVVNPPVGYLGNVYVRSSHAHPDTYGLLIQEASLTLRARTEVKRIESQVFGFNCDVSPLFSSLGMKVLLRHFMVRPLNQNRGSTARSSKGRNFRIIGWERDYFLPVAQVIYSSYQDSSDREMCHDYQSKEGCVRFVRNLIDNPGCGIFDSFASRIALAGDGRVCGALIASLISSNTGMIPQISVRPSEQRQGVGTALLASYFEAGRKTGLEQTSLSVSDRNTDAYRLYHRLGFRTVFDFHAFVWNRD